jgi:type I restriction enzyme M protein
MDITAKLWSYCHILRHDGVDYIDYIEQLTYLLFLKMAEENEIEVPDPCRWQHLLVRNGEELKNYYEFILSELKKEEGILGEIFQEPISKIKNPVSLKKIIDGIESVGWTKLEKDVQGEAFEGLLEKTANEGKKGAGPFFTPRPLIQAIVNVMKPDPIESEGFRIADTACGTAGFLTVAIDWAKNKLSSADWNRVRDNTYYGQELVIRPYRLALMNLFLHGVNPKLTLGDSIYSVSNQKQSISCILTNPPFGTRGVAGPPKERDFPVETSNIQLNFVQHIYEVLTDDGRAAIVLPDSALTDTKGKDVWRTLIESSNCNVHTILRLPRGTFNPYANGVKASVVFLQKGTNTNETWVYDARASFEDITKSSRPLSYQKHFEDFVHVYGDSPNATSKRIESERFKRYTLDKIRERDFDLSFSNLYYPPKLEQPVFYVDKLISNFESQLAELHRIREVLNND